MAFEVGQAFLQVVPSLKGLHKQIAAEVKSWDDIKIDVTPNMRGFREKVAAEAASIRDAHVDVDANVDMSRARAEVGAFATQMRAALEGAIKALPKIELDANADRVTRRIQEIRAELESIRDAQFNADFDDAAALAKIHELETELKILGAMSPDIKVKVDVDKAGASLSAFRKTLSGAGSDSDTFVGHLRNMNGAVDRLQGPFDGMIGRLGRMGLAAQGLKMFLTPTLFAELIPPAIGLGGAIAYASASLLILPGVLTSVATGAIGLKIAFTGIGDALKNMGDPAKFAEALKQLTPAAQEAVKAIAALKPQWDDLRKSVQEKLFTGLASEISSTGNLLISTFKPAFQTVASSANTALKGFMQDLNSLEGKKTLQSIATNGAQAFSNLLEAVRPIGRAFLDIADVGAKVFADLTKGAGGAAQQFADMIRRIKESGALEEMIRNGIDTLITFGKIVGDVGSALHSMFIAAQVDGKTFLETLREGTQAFAAFAKSAPGQELFKAFFTVLRDMQEIILEVVKLGPSLTPVLQALHQGFVALYAPMPQLLEGITAIVQALTPLLPLAGQVGGAIVSGLATVFKELAPIIKDVVAGIQGFVTAALPGLKAGFALAWESIKPFAQTLGELARVILPPLGAALGAIAAVLGPFAGPILAAVVAFKALTLAIKLAEGALLLFNTAKLMISWAGFAAPAIAEFASIGTAATAAGAAGTAAGTGIGAGFLAALAPVAAIAIPLLALAGIAVLVWKNWDFTIQGFKDMWKAINPDNMFIQGFKDAWAGIQAGANAAWQGIKTGWDMFIQGFKDAGTGLVSAASATWGAIKAGWDLYVAGFNLGLSGISAAWSAMWAGISAAASAAWAGITAAGSAIGGFFSGLWASISAGAATMSASAIAAIQGIINKAAEWAGRAWDAVISATDTATAVIQSVISTVGGWIGRAWDAVLSATDTASSVIQSVISTAGGWIGRAWDAVVSATDTATSVIQTIIGKAGEYAGRAWNASIGALDNASGVISSILSSLQQIVGRVWTAVVNTVTGGAGGYVVTPMATGGIIPMQRGGQLTPMSGQVARIVPPQTWRVIGDRLTGAEAFIPINKSLWSIAVLAETAQRMGFTLAPESLAPLIQALGHLFHFAQGGVLLTDDAGRPLSWANDPAIPTSTPGRMRPRHGRHNPPWRWHDLFDLFHRLLRQVVVPAMTQAQGQAAGQSLIGAWQQQAAAMAATIQQWAPPARPSRTDPGRHHHRPPGYGSTFATPAQVQAIMSDQQWQFTAAGLNPPSPSRQIFNVYPREGQSEEAIALMVARRQAFALRS